MTSNALIICKQVMEREREYYWSSGERGEREYSGQMERGRGRERDGERET